jgi:molybdopterin converting factor subunit 1
MSIRILLFASLADIAGTRAVNLEAAGFADVKSVFDSFARKFPLLEKYRSSVLFAVNTEFAKPETPVREGDEIAFFPPVSGG